MIKSIRIRYAHDSKAMRALESGKKLRHCALWHSGLGVVKTKVLFHDQFGNEYGYWMDRETYNAIPLGVAATPEDYAKHGEIVPSEDTNIYSLK